MHEPGERAPKAAKLSGSAAALWLLRGAARFLTHSPDLLEAAAITALYLHTAARLREVVILIALLRALVLLVRTLTTLGRRASAAFAHLAVRDAAAHFLRRVERAAGRNRNRARGRRPRCGARGDERGARQIAEAGTLISRRRHRQSTDQKHQNPASTWVVQCDKKSRTMQWGWP
jgi:hypothetical protein